MIQMKKKKFIIIIIGLIIGTMLLTSGGFYLYTNVINNSVMVKSSDYEQLKTFATKYSKLYELQYMVDTEYLWDTNDDKLMDGVYKGLIDSLDDKYSVYMNADEYSNWNASVSGSFSGVGVTFGEDTAGDFVVLNILKNSPASETQIVAGDFITAVDGKKYTDVDKLGSAIRGKTGTIVSITYKHKSIEKTVKITRADIALESVTSKVLKNNIGYIAISAFEAATATDFKSALSEMELKGVNSLIIDIRNNGGGYSDAGIEIADMLLPECTITYMEDKNGKKKYYNSEASKTDLKYELLVNGNSASTSEILACAIQDNNGGKIIGTKTFGKGIVQSTYTFKDGSALKLTTMQYFSPKGKVIHKIGITPDYIVKLKGGDSTDYQLNKAIELLK